MDGEKRILEYIDLYKQQGRGYANPIFEIVLFEHPSKEMMVVKDGKEIASGLPDANLNSMGYYYDLFTAVQALNENWADIQEHCFHAGFIFCRFPGLYNCVGTYARIYFLWDEERKGFFEAEEPEIFKHVEY